MANKKITDLPELAEAPNDNDLFEIVDVSTGISKRIKAQYLGGGAGSTPTLDEVLAVGFLGVDKQIQLNSTDFGSLAQISSDAIGFIENLDINEDRVVFGNFGFQRYTGVGITSKFTTVQFTEPTAAGGIINIPDVAGSTETLALLSDIPTNTSDLINDGDDGNPFISLLDLPSNIIFYPTNVASDIVGYVKIVTSITDPDYNTTAVDVSTGEITTTSQLISSLATSPNIIVGNPGVFNITTIGNIRRTSGSGTSSFYFQVYKRTSGGTETLIATSANTIPVLDSGTYVEFSSTAIWDDGIFLDTDRVVMKYYANRIAGGSNPTYEFQFGGITPVRTLVPIPLSVVPILTIDATPTDGSTNAVSSNGVFDALALKVEKTSWVDYSATSTVVGWSSFTDKVILYKVIDDAVIINFYIQGTSNATNASFTIANNATIFQNNLGVLIVNNGVFLTTPGRVVANIGSNIINIFRDAVSTVYTNSGVKRVQGEIIIKIA